MKFFFKLCVTFKKALPSSEEIAKRLRRGGDLLTEGVPASKKRKLDNTGDVTSSTESSKALALSVTEEFIVQKLTLKGAAELVLHSLVSPSSFWLLKKKEI